MIRFFDLIKKRVSNGEPLTRMDHYYMKVAKLTAELSRAVKLKVGCVIVKNDSIISFSWNGTPKGFDNCCEYQELSSGDLITLREVVHSEMNAIAKLAKSTESSNGASIYTTHSPCYDCAKAIIQSGISKVYYLHEYRNINPINILKQAGVKVIKMDDNG